MDAIDLEILYIITGDMPLSLEPFKTIGIEIGIEEDEVIRRIEKMTAAGIIKRIAPILHHHKTKFKFNALTMWAIEKDHISDVADYLVQFQHISHVYERATYPEWPYTLYGMLHAESMEDIEVLVRQILAETGDVAYKVVFTTNEWKKTSPDLGYLLRKTVDL